MNRLHDSDDLPLPPLSDTAAVEILAFLEAMHQIFETRYATQIWRYYKTHGLARTTSQARTDDEPF